jgi:hypothetical protein
MKVHPISSDKEAVKVSSVLTDKIKWPGPIANVHLNILVMRGGGFLGTLATRVKALELRERLKA